MITGHLTNATHVHQVQIIKTRSNIILLCSTAVQSIIYQETFKFKRSRYVANDSNSAVCC